MRMSKMSKHLPRGFRKEVYNATIAAVLAIVFALSLTVGFGIWQHVVLVIPYVKALGLVESPVLVTFKEYTTFFCGIYMGMITTVVLVAFGYVKKGHRLSVDVRA